MYLPSFLPWAKQHKPHTHLLHTSSLPPPPSGARSVRVWNVKGRTLSFKLSQPPVSLPPSCSWFLPATLPHVCFLLSFSVTISFFPPSLPLRWAGCCRLQVRGTPQPMKNECRRAPWLWWTSPYVGLSLFSIWLPPEKPPCDTHTPSAHTHTQKWQTLWTKYLSCWRKRLRSGKYAVKRAFLYVCACVCVLT